MTTRRLLWCALTLAALAVLLLGWTYLAGSAYYLLNRAAPAHIEPVTWWLYWQAYGHHPVQRPRLQLAAALAALPPLAVVVALVAALRPAARPLHGDARWASADEIRDAGLL